MLASVAWLRCLVALHPALTGFLRCLRVRETLLQASAPATRNQRRRVMAPVRSAYPTLAALVLLAGCATAGLGPVRPTTWTADNGNGTYTNPLFYEEFSDPDVIRVGEDYYLTGTTMHSMPGLPVLHSRDLVNWRLASYAFQQLDLHPSFRLQGGEIYGQGIWAPVIRHHGGTFYIFSNINGYGTQVFRATSPEGPWRHNRLNTTLYDLAVLFDDDGRIYAIHLADDGVIIEELNREVTDVVPGTRRVLHPRRPLGEGFHAYKVDGTYYILSAIPGAHTPLVAIRSRSLMGPWEFDTLTAGEHLGVHTGNALRARGQGAERTFEVTKRDPNTNGGLTIHQGGIVSTPSGEWWSVIMQDHRSLGRVSALIPVTWENGWPYLGLPGNLRRAPRTWVKPNTGHEQAPEPLFIRSDAFDADTLNSVWQWNHAPDDTRWSLTGGVLRLHSLPAPDFWWARNTLTQRAAGPVSGATVTLDAGGMAAGDVAGLALLNEPYAWIGLVRTAGGTVLRQFDQLTGKVTDRPLAAPRVWLRTDADYEREVATLSYSTDGRDFAMVGDTFTLVYQLKTFQGIRYSLFHYHAGGGAGGYADFDDFVVHEPRPRGLMREIPYGRTITLAAYGHGSVPLAAGAQVAVVPAGDPQATSPAARFRVEDRGRGRVALRAHDGRYVSVNAATGEVQLRAGEPGEAESFQWIEMQFGDVMFLSLANHCYLRALPGQPLTGNHPGGSPDHRDGAGFLWRDAGN
jgi:beta-xylosidase